MTEKVSDEIKRIVFAQKVGECRSREEWRKIYAEGVKDLPVDHVTSCPNCLDIVNELLGLPPLSERSPFEAVSRDSGNDGPFDSAGSSGGSGTKKGGAKNAEAPALFAKLEEARRERFSKAPEELTLAVNGWPIASRRVQPGLNSLTARPRMEEPLESMELLDENGRLLFHLPVNEACASGTDGHWPAVSLGADRSADFAVTWIDENPEIHLEYRDKSLRLVAEATAQMSSAAVPAGGIIDRLIKKFALGWRAFTFWELALAAAALLFVMLLPAALIATEAMRREKIASLENDLDSVKIERERLERRLSEEQARREAAEAERDRLKNFPSIDPQTTSPENEPLQIADGGLGLRLLADSNNPDAVNLEPVRGAVPKSDSIRSLSRKKGARFTIRAPLYDGERRLYNGYLVRLKFPNRPEASARLMPKQTAPALSSIVFEVEIYNAKDLPPGINAEASVYGLIQKEEMLIGKIRLRIE